MSTNGHALWLVWQGELAPTVPQTLQDYGGLCVASENDQALWFFFSLDALLALAKLVIWGKYNDQAMDILAFPGALQVGVGQSLSLSMDKNLAAQQVNPPESGIEVWVHPDLRDAGINIPGLSFIKGESHKGMARARWTLLAADHRLPYTSTQGWYAILRPLGNPIDKNFQAGWRHLFPYLENIIQEKKLKYSLHDNFLMILLDNLSSLRAWVRELLLALGEIKEKKPEQYWPCVNAVVDRRGLNFNNELPQKVNIDWDHLMPDYPFMNYRNAYLLGGDFVIQDRFFSTGSNSLDSWCTVGLRELDSRFGMVTVLMAGQLVSGSQHCFYCGCLNHESNQCPSRRLPPVPHDFWQGYSELDLDEINAAFRNIEIKLSKSGVSGLMQLLSREGPEARVLNGMFAIERDVQLRTVERIWMLTGKDIEIDPDDRSMMDDSPAWSMVERLQRATMNDLPPIEKELAAHGHRNPRDWKVQCLLGFVAVERGDLARAAEAFQRAENLSSFVIQQAWHAFLHAHALEMQGKYHEAMDRYETAKRLLPLWQRPEYRRQLCRIKLGFGERAQDVFVKMVENDPTLFNRLLLDPDLERGRKPVLTGLYPPWVDGQKRSQTERNSVERLIAELSAWFPPENEAGQRFTLQLKGLLKEIDTKNYLSFFNVVTVRPTIEEELENFIQRDIEILQNRFKNYLATLEHIRDEASWFPFQKALVEFNRAFNEAASILNWAFASDFHTPEAFRKGQAHIGPMNQLVADLNKRLKTLRLARDATLFGLILSKTFFWFEILAIVLATVIMVAVLTFGNMIGMLWLQNIVRANFWALQKVIVAIITLTALGVAALRTTLIFEKRRDQMLEEAGRQREEMQEARLERAKARGEALQKQRDAERQAQMNDGGG